jgi:murein L,D-transpeptidase YcbB/YkuD
LSIERNEIVPHIEKDRNYLEKNEYEVTTPSGAVVSSSGAVSDELLDQIRTGKLLVRQVPGTKNALGRVKFMFPNENNVYLHDTPARKLFARSRRDFSHGCIRVERAEDLAEWVLREETGWPRERIVEAMDGPDNRQVILKRPIPVLIVYATAVALEGGEVRFFDDLYKNDAALDRQLTSGARARRPRE